MPKPSTLLKEAGGGEERRRIMVANLDWKENKNGKGKWWVGMACLKMNGFDKDNV